MNNVNDDTLNSGILSHLDPDVNFFSEVIESIRLDQISQYLNIDQFNSMCMEEKGFNILNMNIRSYFANECKFNSLMSTILQEPEIIVLTETWLTEMNKDYCNLNGYVAFHTIREIGRSGGVSIFVKNDVQCKLINEFSLSNSFMESCTVEISINEIKYVLLAVYRSHHTTILQFNTYMNDILNNEYLKNKNIILLGDLNINLLGFDNNERDFIYLMNGLKFIPAITKATRISDVSHCQSNLDHIWINTLESFKSGILTSELTDHLPTFIILSKNKCPERVKKEIKFRDHSELFFNKFLNDVKNFNWNQYLSKYCIENKWEKLTEILNSFYIKNFPIRSKYISLKRFNNPWLTSGIMKSIKTKSYYFKLVKAGRFSRDRYKNFCRILDTLIRKSKREFYIKCFDNCIGDTKQTWKLINGLVSKRKNRNVDSIKHDGISISGNENIANAFNVYFSKIAKQLDENIPIIPYSPFSFVQKTVSQTIYLTPTTNYEIEHILKGLKNTKSGLNCLPVPFLKLISEFICPIISELINESYQIGIFPGCLKVARIIPIHKGGDNQVLNNYRPIAMLPVLSKIFEKTICSRLLSFAHKYDIITKDQFGFLKGKNTSQAIHKLIEDIYKSFNNKYNLISVFLDFRKAFDTVNHKILLGKLGLYGIRGLANRLLASYFDNRFQCVQYNSAQSNHCKIKIGVPQGSILGPLLFLFYINDLSSVSNTLSTVLYADDTTLYASDRDLNNLTSKINLDLKNIENWTHANRLSLHPDKTVFMLFSLNKNISIPNLYVENISLKLQSKTKFLGVILDDKLKFSEYLQYIALKISKSVGIIYRVKHLVPRKILVNLYYSLVFPYLTYCCTIWGSTYSVHLKPLEILQKKIIRLITNSGFTAHTTPLFYELGILKLEDIRRFNVAIYMYSNVNQNESNNIPHNYSTRHRSNIRTAFNRLTLSQHSMSHVGPQVWNSIPLSLRNISKLSTFKKALKLYFLEQYCN